MTEGIWATPLVFVVAGTVVGEGSMQPFTTKGADGKITARVRHRGTAALEDWRHAIATEARGALRYRKAHDQRVAAGAASWPIDYAEDLSDVVLSGAVRCNIIFRRQRPMAHYMRDGLRLKASAPAFWDCAVTPDVDKLARAVLDALTGVVWRDDKQVAALSAVRWWSGPDVGAAGATITVELLTDGLGDLF